MIERQVWCVRQHAPDVRLIHALGVACVVHDRVTVLVTDFHQRCEREKYHDLQENQQLVSSDPVDEA